MMNTNSKEIMVNLMLEKICEYIDADEVHRICVHGKEFAEVKKGKWISRKSNVVYPEWERYTCSVCGMHSDKYDFCPHCGADMRKETNK